MKQNYNKHIKLICATCGSSDFFDKNEKTGVITCKKCNRVYNGGYDEIVELNEKTISSEVESMKKEVEQDIIKDLNNMFKKAGFKLK
ncbi:hypothetical protein [uncultured Prevotella sp.]|uniref:hypothetical protein n=1 Tax=uncultured Prevotella sp. TaxID=159272 RepID=UPI00266BC56F|nr:hypothetical protein [uncultured Prevotella sp.]